MLIDDMKMCKTTSQKIKVLRKNNNIETAMQVNADQQSKIATLSLSIGTPILRRFQGTDYFDVR